MIPEATASGIGAGEDLYEYDLDKPLGERLADLSVDKNDLGGGAVQGMLGVSANGAYAYFVANGVLAPGAKPGNCVRADSSSTETCNLYVSHEGKLAFIAILSSADDHTVGGEEGDWLSELHGRATRVSGDGTKLVFMSQEPLTGYDNRGVEEVFLYDASTARISCISCNPGGEPPAGGSSIPGGSGITSGLAIYQPRVLSEGLPGNRTRVFFDSGSSLVPEDTNGREDVYEWEQPGVGSCTESSPGFSTTSGGCVALISGGTYNDDSSFLDASVTGDNVFFVTGQQLVTQDNDELVDLYDARENGGITVLSAPPVCSGTGCQGVPHRRRSSRRHRA